MMDEQNEGHVGGGAGYKVVLLDDDHFLLDMYSMKFSKDGFSVHACLSVDEALNVLRGGYDPDAVVFDIMMPQKDGCEFLKTVRAERLAEGSAFIVLTNQDSERERLATKEFKADSYVVKATMIPSEVVNIVSEMIKKKKGHNV